jgi:hypothetical protein
LYLTAACPSIDNPVNSSDLAKIHCRINLVCGQY